ncbi:MAG TPA: hypothetical protein P5552_15835 [Candidatus Competibacteraceae bacterium]|nr:hypothetical protein [Candidatus Competibacteraceae bacterium]
MPQSFSVRLFDHWLEQNRARFRHPPTAIVRRKRSRAFRFAGVTLLIWGHVCDWRLRLPTVRGRRSKGLSNPSIALDRTWLRILAGLEQRTFSA